MNILHMEKSSLVSGIVKRIIEESGNSVKNGDDSSSCMEILNNEKIDFIVIGLDNENPEGELFLKKMHEKDIPLIPVLVLTEDDNLALDQRLFCYGVIDIINKKYISDDNFKKFFDVFFREDRLLKELRNVSIAVLDENNQGLSCYKALFDFYEIKNVEYFSEPEELLFCSTCHDFYILDVSMPRVSGEDVIKNIRERNRDSFVTAVTSSEHERVLNNIVVAGADSYMIKPFTANLFMSRIKADVRHYVKIKKMQKKIK